MSEPAREQTREGLDSFVARPSAVVLDTSIATRRADWSQTGGNGWGHRGYRSSTRRSRGVKGDRQMSFPERVIRELRLIYEELLSTPPIVLLVLSCLAILLVGAIIVGATRP
jgi:hypothetical protein